MRIGVKTKNTWRRRERGARMRIRIWPKMVNKVKCNFKNLKRGSLKCDMCSEAPAGEPGWKEEVGMMRVPVTSFCKN